MKLLRIAVEKRRWDLAAHTIVMATASALKNGDKPGVVAGKVRQGGRENIGRKKRRA